MVSGWNVYKPYICVTVDKQPVVIFKSAVIAVEKSGQYANIICFGDLSYHTRNKYEDVVKALIE